MSIALVPRNEILVGDAHEELARLPDASVDMVLTSPPYFRLRDYQMEGQLGLEQAVNQWVDRLTSVSNQVHRVLTPSGSLWLNVADTYSTHSRQGAAKKSLLLGPERLAVALVNGGWLLRNKIVWAKTNPMPSSARDRLTCTWEALYVFVKQAGYFFDLGAVRVPHRSTPAAPRKGFIRQRARESWRGPNGDDASGLTALKAAGRVGHPLGKNPGDVWQLASSTFRGAHHATFPVALAERAIRAGCPQARCVRCLQPWQQPLIHSLGGVATRGVVAATCHCEADSEPGLVLDPFFGAGSTAIAADKLHRDWVGIELNPEFAGLAGRRIAAARGDLTAISLTSSQRLPERR